MNAIELNLNHIWLEIEPEQIESAEQKVENIDVYNFQSYTNQLALEIVLPYIHEEYPQAAVSNFDHTQFWQFGVNGVAINFDDKKLVLVPSDAYDIDEFRVSQELVDIPELAADYYLAVQVDVEDSSMRIWGYTTHKELKETGTYCDRDRSYFITREQITEDINALWLMRKYFPDKSTKAAIAPIPELSETELAALLDRLVNPEIRLVRRSIPFSQWAYVFSDQKLRTELMVNRLIHSTLLTYLRSTSDDTIDEIRNKQFENQELAAVAEQLNNIYRNEDEDDLPYEGEGVLMDFMRLSTNKERTRNSGGIGIPRLKEDDDEDDLGIEADVFETDEELMFTRGSRGGTYGLVEEDEDDLEDKADLFNLTESLFEKLKGIWSNNKSNDSEK